MAAYTQADPTTSPTYRRPDDGRPSYKRYLQSHSRQWSTLILEICHFCPVACSHCHIGSDTKSRLALTESQIRDAIAYFASLPTAEYVMCTGGEPFSYLRELKTALETIRDSNLVSYTLTSGVWAKSFKHADSVLADLPPIGLFAVSIDSYHADQIGIEAPINALRAAVSRDYSSFVCIGHRGLDDPFRDHVLRSLGKELRESIDVIYYPLLARGSGADLPELEGRELSRPANAPCFSIGAPLITANGAVSACCHTTQANKARKNETSPLTLGDVSSMDKALRLYAEDCFARAMRTIGPAQMARDCKLAVPDQFSSWDICQACEFLHQPDRYQSVLTHLKAQTISDTRLAGLDELLSQGSSSQLREHLLLMQNANE